MTSTCWVMTPSRSQAPPTIHTLTYVKNIMLLLFSLHCTQVNFDFYFIVRLLVRANIYLVSDLHNLDFVIKEINVLVTRIIKLKI